MRTFKLISRIAVKLFMAAFIVQLAVQSFVKEVYVVTLLSVIMLVVIIILKPSNN